MAPPPAHLGSPQWQRGQRRAKVERAPQPRRRHPRPRRRRQAGVPVGAHAHNPPAGGNGHPPRQPHPPRWRQRHALQKRAVCQSWRPQVLHRRGTLRQRSRQARHPRHRLSQSPLPGPPRPQCSQGRTPQGRGSRSLTRRAARSTWEKVPWVRVGPDSPLGRRRPRKCPVVGSRRRGRRRRLGCRQPARLRRRQDRGEGGAAVVEQGPRAEAPCSCGVTEARGASAVPGAQGLRWRSEQAAWRPQGTADLPIRVTPCA